MPEAKAVTVEHINSLIMTQQYHRFPNTTTTVCCLKLRNGYCVTGESACVHLSDYDAEIGQRIAYENAFEKIWALEGYLLKQALHDDRQPAAKEPYT